MMHKGAVFRALLYGRHTHKVVLILIWDQYFLVFLGNPLTFFTVS